MAAVVCQYIGKLCSGCVKCCSGPCDAFCGTLGQALCSPFFPYLALTCGLNVPPTVWALKTYLVPQPALRACPNALWLGIYAIGTAANLIGAFYIASQISTDATLPATTTTPATTGTTIPVTTGRGGGGFGRSTKNTTTVEPVAAEEAQVLQVEEPNTKHGGGGGAPSSLPQAFTYYRRMETTHGTFQSYTYMSNSGAAAMRGLDGSPNSIMRLGHVLCFDKGVAVYIVVAIAWMIWFSVGFSRMLFGKFSNDGNGGDCDIVNKWAVNSIIMGFCYMMMVCVAFACSLCCLR